ncbi:cysteine proteinase [Violaceomyces palustris]|uniref:Cysteine proteinase n=1 Tax=Violaceomyces palustris TaxID=1673888 RepID=A0ACD0P8I1_9BASI|nr:cysteine proteinase [Violaceomyces palustris]
MANLTGPTDDGDTERLDHAQLSQYLSRIQLPPSSDLGNPGGPTAELATLKAVVKSHLSSIPYENLDLHYQVPGSERTAGPPCSIRLPGTFEKMVQGRRGGYCLELNSLLAQALRSLGFVVHSAQARIVYEQSAPSKQGQTKDLVGIQVEVEKSLLGNAWPTHILLIVQTRDGSRYLVDTGLAKFSLTEPLLIPSSQGRWSSLKEEEDWVEKSLARGILGKLFRLRRSKVDPDARGGAREVPSYYLQVSIPSKIGVDDDSDDDGGGVGGERVWKDYYHFADRKVERQGEDFIHEWMSKGPESVSPRYPFVTMPVRGVGQVSLHDQELVIRQADPPSLSAIGEEDDVEGPEQVKEALLHYFGIPPSYDEPPRERVLVAKSS